MQLPKFRKASVVRADLTLTPSLTRFRTDSALTDFFDNERKLIAQRRIAADSSQEGGDTGLVGLAFSGGGIRSATFGLGVLEAFESRGSDVMKHVDYLSTVSGGGFLGGAYSTWRYRQAVHGNPPSTCPAAINSPPAELRALVPHLRKFGRYLAPRLGLLDAEPWRIVGTFVRNIVIHWMVLVSAVFALFAALLLGVRHLYATSFVALVVGFCMVGIGVFKEWRARRCLAKREQDPLRSCDEAQKLMQAPHLLLFIGLGLSALGAALSFVTTTRLYFPELKTLSRYFDWWSSQTSQVAVASGTIGETLASTVALPAALTKALQAPGFATAAGVFGVALLVLSIAAWVSSWRWSRRALYVPGVRWFGLPLVVALYFLLWYALAYSEGTFATRTWEGVPLTPGELLSFYTVKDAADAWGWVWKTGAVIFTFGALISVMIATFNARMDREEREWLTRLVSVALMVASAWVVVGGLVVFSAWLAGAAHAPASIASALAAAGAWVGVSAWVAKVASSESVKTLAQKYWKQLLLRLGPPAFLVGLVLLGGFAAASLAIWLGDGPAALWAGDAVLWLLLGSVGVFLVFGWLLDANEFALHGFFRDRIVRCYLGASNNDSPASDSVWNIRSDDIPLSCLAASIKQGAPFHIVNTAVNLFGSKDLQVRQRNCDSFVLTPTGCGSWATNFAEIPSRLYLGSAVAASGAAVSSAMGMATHGAALAALMTVFNVRLGYWFGNPRFGNQRHPRPFFPPALLFTEALSSTNEDRAFVNLSDGGHFDNLGLYELIRRRCKFIIVVDAECDEHYGFESLEQVIRFASIDFGVHIDIKVRDIAPEKPDDRYARAHWALGTISYRDCGRVAGGDRGLSPFGESDVGHLLYIKSSLVTPDNNSYITPDVLGYAQRHPSFPHENTADQFFSEAQFESYRNLGRAIGQKLLAGWNGEDLAALFSNVAKPAGAKRPTRANSTARTAKS